MLLTWREKEYEFKNRSLPAFKDKQGPRAKVTVDAPIFAFDTESVNTGDRYEPICYQLSAPYGPERLEYLPEKSRALEHFLTFFIDQYSDKLFSDEEKYVFMYAHNLTYDWNQLVKNYPDLLAMARTGVGLNTDYALFPIMNYDIVLKSKGLFTGTAPHFDIGIKYRNQSITMMFRDTWSFFPVSLDSLTRQLQVTVKLKRPENIGKIDYRKLPDTDPEKISFEAYAKVDAKGTRETAEKIRTLHKLSGMGRIRVSAPSYSAAKLYHTMEEGTKLFAGTNDESIMQLVLDAYAGGRTGGIYHGKVLNITVADIHSSYPASACTLPSFTEGMEYFRYPNPEELNNEELIEILDTYHCFITISGEETNATYPTLIQSKKGKLYPVYGKFEKLSTTGIELCVGLKSGTIKISRIHDLVLLIDNDENPIYPIRDFMRGEYQRKANAIKDSPEYLSAKLPLNAFYGKLIESHDNRYIDGEAQNIILPYEPGKQIDYSNLYYNEYIESLKADSTEDFETRTDKILDFLIENEIEYSLADFGYLSLTKLDYGRYVIPAAAALITGTSRARLIAAIRGTGALYWDTDSIFIPDFDLETAAKQFELASTWLPKFIQPLTFGPDLGEFGFEIENADGYLAGTKRYYIANKDHAKQALHGMPTAPYDKAAEMIEALATGRNCKYEGRPRPLTAKDAKTPEEVGLFCSKDYESCFELDARLNWTRDKNGWRGTVKEFGEIGNKCLTDSAEQCRI